MLVRQLHGIGGLMSFNVEHGFLEAIVRGYRSGLLQEFEYRQLCQCDNLDDVKLALGDTDYCNVLQNVNKLTPDVILDRCTDKFIAEFEYLRTCAMGPLRTFLDFITYEHLIQNISYVITSLIKGADAETLLAKCHPLGRSPHLKAIMTFENFENADGLVELYRTVLVDTPVARYFEKYFNSEIKDYTQPSRDIQRVYNEVEIDIITNMIQKHWLEDFYNFTQQYCGGTTGEIMRDLLEFEADRRAISITINSFGTNLNEPYKRDAERKSLYCNFGKLYPEATMDKFSKVGDMNQLAGELERYKTYHNLWRKSQEGGRSFNDLMYQEEVRLNLLAFEQQSHFACFYGWVALKKQELRNLKWILACINQRRDAKDLNRWIKIV